MNLFLIWYSFLRNCIWTEGSVVSLTGKVIFKLSQRYNAANIPLHSFTSTWMASPLQDGKCDDALSVWGYNGFVPSIPFRLVFKGTNMIQWENLNGPLLTFFLTVMRITCCVIRLFFCVTYLLVVEDSAVGKVSTYYESSRITAGCQPLRWPMRHTYSSRQAFRCKALFYEGWLKESVALILESQVRPKLLFLAYSPAIHACIGTPW